MDTNEALAIPSFGKERHIWHIPEDAPVSRSRRSRGNGEYESTVPIKLAGLNYVFPFQSACRLCKGIVCIGFL